MDNVSWHPTTVQGEAQISRYGHSNLVCVCAVATGYRVSRFCPYILPPDCEHDSAAHAQCKARCLSSFCKFVFIYLTILLVFTQSLERSEATTDTLYWIFISPARTLFWIICSTSTSSLCSWSDQHDQTNNSSGQETLVAGITTVIKEGVSAVGDELG